MLFPFALIMPRIMKVIGLLQSKAPDSIKYLPSIYHAEAEEKFSPLWALLLTIEHFFGQVEEKITDIDRYIDISRAPTASGEGQENKDFLSWLSTWAAFDLDQSWPGQKKRYAVRNAAELYKYRGTITGLSYMLALFFGIEVEVREWTWPRGMQVGVQDTPGIDTVLHERPNRNYCFVLTWRVPPGETGAGFSEKIKKIRAMIDRERPVHTKCYFEVKEA